MSYQDGALIEPIGVGAGAVQRAEPEENDTVVIQGAGVVVGDRDRTNRDLALSPRESCFDS